MVFGPNGPETPCKRGHPNQGHAILGWIGTAPGAAERNLLELKIEKGGLVARLSLVPIRKETGGYVIPSLAEIGLWIKEQGIQAPMDVGSVEAGLDRIARGMGAEVVAVRGNPPVPGRNGHLEILLDFAPGFAPTDAEGGSVDLRASLIRNVTLGQPLAVIHAPSAGRPGLDVFGRLLAAEPGKEFKPKFGRNTCGSPHDANLIVAAAMGHARLRDGVVEVEEFYLVDGDVDYGSGNVAFGKSVLIRGDVKSGFSIEAGGDVEIGGLVEDCAIKSKGDVLVKGGFTGQGKGTINATGNVRLGFVRNQQVRSESGIQVLKEAVNSRLQSRQNITVNGLLAGGRAQALRAIECQTAGTETGTPTHLEAGFDFTVSEQLAEIRQEMEKMGGYSRKLEDSLHQIHDIEKLNRGLEPWTIDLMFEMEAMRSKVESKIRSLRERFSSIERGTLEPESAVITVHGKAFPGVVVKIGKEVLLVDQILPGPKTFFSQDGVIRVR